MALWLLLQYGTLHSLDFLVLQRLSCNPAQVVLMSSFDYNLLFAAKDTMIAEEAVPDGSLRRRVGHMRTDGRNSFSHFRTIGVTVSRKGNRSVRNEMPVKDNSKGMATGGTIAAHGKQSARDISPIAISTVYGCRTAEENCAVCPHIKEVSYHVYFNAGICG